jgi:hypothetical protein
LFDEGGILQQEKMTKKMFARRSPLYILVSYFRYLPKKLRAKKQMDEESARNWQKSFHHFGGLKLNQNITFGTAV